MYYLGIDWGQSKCGLAIADQENRIASIYKQVTEKNVYNEVFDLVQKEKIEKIIIGFNEKLLRRKIFNLFLEKIKKMGVPVELENEDFSTQIAHHNLKDADQKKIFQGDDVESSRVILQGWLDKKSNK
jgi:putative Holliday junction resolvase